MTARIQAFDPEDFIMYVDVYVAGELGKLVSLVMKREPFGP